MTVSVQTKLRGAEEILRSLKAVGSAIESGTGSGVGRRVGYEGVRIIRKLTPRNNDPGRLPGSKRGYKPIADQWKLIEEVTGQSSYRAVIRNDASRSQEGLAVLASIEFGAKRHEIRPKNAPALRWKQSGRRGKFVGRSLLDQGDRVDEFRLRRRRQSELILALEVNHPGHAPFHMVRDTRTQLRRTADESLRVFRKRIESVYGSLSISVG